MKLEEGEVICPNCEGKGVINKPFSYMKNEVHYDTEMPLMCYRCHGSGKLDWIEAVVGKRSNAHGFIQDLDISSLYHNSINPIITANQGSGKSKFYLDYIDLLNP